MTELAAFGKDEGTLHLENSNAVGITDLFSPALGFCWTLD